MVLVGVWGKQKCRGGGVDSLSSCGHTISTQTLRSPNIPSLTSICSS